MIKKMTFISGLALLLAVQTSCRENEFGTVDLTMPEDVYEPVEGQYTYNHPCAMYSQADFDRVKAMLDDGSAPQEQLREARTTVMRWKMLLRLTKWRCFGN